MRTFAPVCLFVILFACGGPAKPDAAPSTSVTPAADTSPTPAATSDAPDASVAPAVPESSVAVVDASAPAVAVDGCGGTAAPYELKVRPEVKKCFFEAKKTHPLLTGEVHIGLNVDMQGRLQKAVIQEEKDLGKDGVACVQRALKCHAPADSDSAEI